MYRRWANKTLLFLVLFLLSTPLTGVVSCTCSDHYNDKVVWVKKSSELPPMNKKAANVSDNANVGRIATHIIPGNLKEIFNDSNHIQLPAAEANGITPITDFKTAYYVKKPLVKITTSNIYFIDSLKHSMPYLVPKAANLLKEIATAFADTIMARGNADYRIRVTSLLRTDYSVSRLQKRNRAATSQSCHLYGTTFDISWVKFDCLDPNHPISLEDLKNVLAEIVFNFREQGRCFAIFERKQGCFHITVR